MLFGCSAIALLSLGKEGGFPVGRKRNTVQTLQGLPRTFGQWSGAGAVKSCFRQGVTLKKESEMLEMASRAYGCCEGKARSGQTGWASKESPSASHFCAVKASGAFTWWSGWTDRRSVGRLGARAQGTNAGPFTRAPHAWSLYFFFFFFFTVGPSVESLLFVSNDPSASFLCYFVFHI